MFPSLHAEMMENPSGAKTTFSHVDETPEAEIRDNSSQFSVFHSRISVPAQVAKSPSKFRGNAISFTGASWLPHIKTFPSFDSVLAAAAETIDNGFSALGTIFPVPYIMSLSSLVK